MGELRTVFLKKVVTVTPDTEALLVEKKMRIKKIELMVDIQHSVSASGTCLLGKRETAPESKRHGDLAILYITAPLVNATIYRAQKHIVIDYGADYVEIEEDDYLYLWLQSTAGTITGYAIIYYEE